MGLERFDVLLRDAKSGATIQRTWDKVGMINSVAWLKRMNARGHNVYVRPHGEHGLALLDSIRAECIANLRSKGFAPAISTEVSGNEFQAWVKLSHRALPEPLRRLAEAGLSRVFGGKADDVVLDGYGRLAGCVRHVGDLDTPKRAKYALAHSGSVEIPTQASIYIAHVQEALKGMEKREGKGTDIVQHPSLPNRPLDRER